jgi:membrane-anchored glycerophosphoryl diester phosphodiesterase (GDPDase)
MIIIASLIESIVSYFIFLRGAVIVAKKQKEFSWHGWFKFLILVIIQQLAALLSIYNLKYLLIPVSAIILACAGIFLLALSSTNYVFVLLGLLFFLISMLLVLAYIIVMVYNSTRLVLAVPVFIQKKIGIMDSLKESWELAKGNVLIIFAMLLFLGLVLSAVNWVISLPLGFFLGAGSQFAPQNASQAIAIMINPLVLLISIPQVLIQSYFLSVQAIMLLAIHSELS